MAKLNTAIRGSQIADAVAGDGIEWASDDILGLDLKANDGLVIDTTELTVDYDDTTIGIKTNKLAVKDGGIDTLQLAANAVETAKILDDNVTLAKLEDGTDAQMIICSGAGAPTYVAVTGGDVSIDNAGSATIGADKVTKLMINVDVAGDGIAQAAGGELDLDLNELTAADVNVANDSIVIIDADDSNASRKESIADLATAMAGTGITAVNGVLNADAVTDNIIETDIKVENESSNCTGAQTTFTLDNTPVVNSVQVFLNGLLQEEGSGKDYTLSGTTVEFATAPASGDILIIHYILND